MPDPIDIHELERLRRSVVMLTPQHPSALNREAALQLLEELQRLRRADERLDRLIMELRALLAATETRSR
jgi:hypothetical protein